MKGNKRITWTFAPDQISKSVIAKATTKAIGRAPKGMMLRYNALSRGVRTRLLNEAIHAHYKKLMGKREREA